MLPTTTSGGEVPLAPSEIVGVEKERVDTSTLQLIDYLFPGHHGITFLAAFLRLAEAKQLVLPELGFADSADMAVVTAQSIRALAKRMGMAYDTVEKYVVVMSQLQLLFKKRSLHQILFYFPLRLCKLPEPEVLDRIQEMRPTKRTPRYRAKVRSFASQVKRRFVLLCKGGKAELAISSPSVVSLSDTSLVVPQLMEDIHLILQQEVDSQNVDSETASRLVMKIGETVHSHWPQSRLLLQKGDSAGEEVFHQSLLFPKKDDSLPGKGSFEGTLQEQKSPFSGKEGDSTPEPSVQKSRLVFPKGDSVASPLVLQEQKATLLTSKGDSVGETSDGQSRLSPKKGDSVRVQALPDEQESTFSGPKGDSLEPHGASPEQKSTFFEPKGDSLPTPPAASLNDNVSNNIYITRNGSVNINDAAGETNQTQHCSGREAGRIGQQLAYFLENSPEHAGGFVNKVKKCGPTIVQAAIIDLLVHQTFPLVDPMDLRGRPLNKARWFHGACDRFAVPGTHLPTYVTKWLSTGYSWPKIQHDLEQAAAKYERYMIGDAGAAGLVREWLRGGLSEEELEAKIREVERQRAGSLTPGSISEGNVALSPDKLWLDEAEARLLAKVMPGELDALCDEIAALGGKDLPRGATAAAKQKQGDVWEVELDWKELPFPVRFASLLRWRKYVEEQREWEKKDIAQAAAKGK